MDGPAGTWTAERVRLTAGSAALVTLLLVAVTVLRNVVVTARQPIGWGVASLTVAILLAPFARRYDRFTNRGLAIALAVVPLAVLALLVGVRIFTEVQQQVERLEVLLPEAAADLEGDEGLGAVARDLELGDRVQDVVAGVRERVTQQATLQRAVGTAPSYLVNGILVVFFLVWGRRMWEGFLRQLPDARRPRVAGAVARGVGRGRWYLLAAGGQAVVLGGATALACWALELPAPAVLGLVAGTASLVPAVGIVLGAVPLLLVAGASLPGTVTAVLGVAAVAAQVAAGLLASRLIHPRSVHVGPAVIVVAALLGTALYGLGGAAVLTVLVVFAVAALDATPTGEGGAVRMERAAPADPF